ncbi:cadherin-23-like [Mercenaria mercenaria]|uniref:cadherin-23-like n=1 Tax=Mercenaria mercenaria TaxID=6596 RepID=UPI00234E96AE|nr:cadherin-23-like [Mercenaria mercenaria]
MSCLNRIFFVVLTVFVGCTHASAPYPSYSGPSYRGISEDYLGSVCRLRVVDDNQWDILTVRPANDITAQYFNIVPEGYGNDFWVNVTVRKPLDIETLGSMVKLKLSITDTELNMALFDFTVYIMDVNDNSPEFQNLPYTLEMPELPCKKSSVVYTNIHAIDTDRGANGRVRFMMEVGITPFVIFLLSYYIHYCILLDTF